MDVIGRKILPHTPPLAIDPSQAFFFLTICVAQRGQSSLISVASQLLSSVKFYEENGKWYPHVFLIMPDHLHVLLRFPSEKSMTKTVRDWKRWTARMYGTKWQDGFFDHRLRSGESSLEKADYILQNPVRAGLVSKAEDWPHVYFGNSSQH